MMLAVYGNAYVALEGTHHASNTVLKPLYETQFLDRSITSTSIHSVTVIFIYILTGPNVSII